MTKNKTLQNILIIIAICFSLIFLVGCADVNYRRIYSKTGVIIDEVYIALHKDTFTSGQAETLYGTIKSDVDTYSKAVDAWIKTNFGGKYVEDISVEDFMRNGIKIEITNVSTTAEAYTFSFFISFGSIEHFVYFYGLNTDEVISKYNLDDFKGVEGFNAGDYSEYFTNYVLDDYSIDESKLFTKDYVWSSDNAYNVFATAQRTEDMSYIDYYCSRINSILGQAYTQEEVLDNINIVQCFETDDNRFKSNADSTYIDSELGYIVHAWDINDETRDIEIIRSRPVSVWWYVLALVVTGIFVAILFIKNKKKKNSSIKIDNEEVNDGQ